MTATVSEVMIERAAGRPVLGRAGAAGSGSRPADHDVFSTRARVPTARKLLTLVYWGLRDGDSWLTRPGENPRPRTRCAES